MRISYFKLDGGISVHH